MSEASRQRPLIDLDDLERQLREASRPRQAGQSTPADDPLAELARIVGQDDPFRGAFQSGRRQTASGADPRADEDWREAARAPRAVEPELRADASARVRAEAGGAQVVSFDEYLRPSAQEDAAGAPPEPDEGEPVYQAEGQLPPHDDDYGADFAPRRSRKGLYVAASVSGLALIGVIGAAAMGGLGGTKLAATQTPPVIKADAGPIKVAPQNPGGVDVPHQNQQIYDRTAEAKAAKIVGSDEQPVDVAQATRKDIAQTGSTAEQGALQTPRPLPSGAPIPGLGEPKRVRTVLVRPDGSVIDDAAAPASASAPAASAAAPRAMAMASPMPTMIPPPMPGVPAATSPRAATTPDGAAKGAPTSTTAAVPALPKPVKTTPAADVAGKPAPTATTSAPAKAPAPARQQVAAIQSDTTTDAGASAAGGGFSVQLAAPASESEAKDTLARLQRRFGAELTGYKLGIRKADIGERTVYRIRVGGLSREDASGLCAKLQAAGGQCFIAKN